MLAFELIYTFTVGGTLYGMIELLFRRRTHWTMMITGGICFMFLYLMTSRSNWPLIVLCLSGALFITAAELIVGCIVNLGLHWDIWDYSGVKYNILGQVCPTFTLCWFLLCFPGVWLSGIIYGHLLRVL